MFGYDGYTLAEVAERFDCTEEGLLDALRAFAHRKCWLFGPLLFEKQTINEMAPEIRAMMQHLGTTRADREARKQELERTRQAIEQHQANIAEIQRRQRVQREAFFREMEAIQHAALEKRLRDEGGGGRTPDGNL